MRRNIIAICLAVAFTNIVVNATAVGETAGQSIESLVADARAAQLNGDFNAAAELYQEAVKLDPSIAELWANLGLMYHELKKPSEAIESLTKAARLKPSLYVLQLFLGIEYLQMKQATLALPHLERAAKMNASDSQALLALGQAYEMLDRPDRAAAIYKQGTLLNPRDGNTWLKLGTAFLQQVESDARAMTSTYRESPYYFLRAAETLVEQGKLTQAEKAYRSTLFSPLPPRCAHAEFGIALLQENRVAEAREEFRSEMDGAQSCGLASLGDLVADLRDGHVDTALKKLKSTMAKDPEFVRSNFYLFRSTIPDDRAPELLNLAHAQNASNDPSAEAAKLLEQVMSSDDPSATKDSTAELFDEKRAFSPASADRFNRTGQYAACSRALISGADSLPASQQEVLAFCSFYAGDYQTAQRAASHLKLNPRTKPQGLYWESKADQKLAVAALSRAGEIDPDSPRMHVLIGDVLRQGRHWSEAEAEYRKAATLDPKSRSARLSLAIVLFTELKLDESFQLDQSVLAEAPEDAGANLLAGEILVQQNEFGKAEPYLLKCRDIDQEFAPRVHILLGKVYSETGRIGAAIDEYKQGLAGDENGSAHYQLGRLYLKSGDKAAADEAFMESKRRVKQWNSRALAGTEQMGSDASPN